MNALRQIAAVSLMNLRSLPQRIGASSVVVIGIAGVVAVLVSVLAMSTGLVKTLQSAGPGESRHRGEHGVEFGTPEQLDARKRSSPSAIPRE